MSSLEVLTVLEAARDHVKRAWAQGFFGNWPHGHACASTAIWTAVADEYSYGVAHAAHVAFLLGAGIPLPDDETDIDTICRAVYRFNDAQTSVDPVMAAFSRAIAALRTELKPKGSDMTDSQEVLAVLEAARVNVARNWGFCASTAILTEVADEGYSLGVAKAAHAAFLRGAGIRVPDGEYAARKAVYRFNDAQRTVDLVVAAFDKAIATVRAELERPKQLPAGYLLKRLVEDGRVERRKLEGKRPEYRVVC